MSGAARLTERSPATRGTVARVAQAWITGGRFLSPEMVCEIVPGMTVAITAARGAGEPAGPELGRPSLRTIIYRESDILGWVLGSEVETRPEP